MTPPPLPPFGTFPKIHPFLKGQASLKLLSICSQFDETCTEIAQSQNSIYCFSCCKKCVQSGSYNLFIVGIYEMFLKTLGPTSWHLCLTSVNKKRNPLWIKFFQIYSDVQKPCSCRIENGLICYFNLSENLKVEKLITYK